MKDEIEFKISEGLIKPIIQSKINAAIVEAMGGHEKMIVDMVSAFMNQKVDSDGKSSSYGSAKPRFEQIAHKLLEEAIKEALSGYFQAKKDVLAKEVEKFFSSKKGSSLLTEAILKGILLGLGDRWRTTITFTPPSQQ